MTEQSLCLFDDFAFDVIQTQNREKKREKEAYIDALHLNLSDGVTFTGAYQMPIVSAVDIAAPNDIMSFHRAIPKRMKGVVPHFYVSDDMIERVWNHWEHYEQSLSAFEAVISTDFSMYREMPAPQRMYNCYRNKLLAARWQRDGLIVVPNVSWSDEASLDYAIDGWPKHSVIAINSTGLRNDRKGKYLWQIGYQHVVASLEPTLILRYGAKQPGEMEDISIYYENDNLKSARNGWKW